MSLKDRIGDEIKAAMKAKDKVRLNTVRSVKKVILEKESELRAKGIEELTEEQEMEILTKLAKQRRDSVEQFTKANREDLAEKEAQELTILEEFLPAQMTEEEIAVAVEGAIAKTGASSPKDMGKVMGLLMKDLKGKADGKVIQTLVKEKLNS
ncbi:MAG: GatB/YqeY domain-containing protein [Cyanobacteria bacterium P01_F01_bin.153]